MAILRTSLLALGAMLAAIQFVRPARTNPVSAPEDAMASHRTVPAAVAEIFDRSCRDCHSNDTRWPWYSHVAPVSWFVIDHVNHGRSHFNYSKWASYDPEQRKQLLEQSCQLARKRAMPLGSYLLMHSTARLSDADVDALCSWAATRLHDGSRRAQDPPATR